MNADEIKKADEIVKALRNSCAGCNPTPCCEFEVFGPAAADLIESLQSQLAAERAKYAELQRYNVDCTKACDRQMVEILELREQNTQLSESQRREQAAVEDLSGICGQIDDDEYLRKAFCIHPGNEDCPSEKENGYVDVDDCVGCPLFENSWRGPQDGKGETE